MKEFLFLITSGIKFIKYSVTLSLLPVLGCCLYSGAVQAFESNGYIRSGVIWAEKEDTTCFQLPGARTKYRLGNECETYGELSFKQDIFKLDNAAYLTASVMSGFVTDAQDGFEELNNFWPEAYIQTGGWFDSVLLNQANIWLGKRYYRRHDIHISDFYYWSNSGYGAGIEDIQLGSIRFAYAYRRNAFVDSLNLSGHDLRLYDIKTNRNGGLTVGLDLRRALNHPVFNNESGQQLHIQHLQNNVHGGYNKFALQFARGIATNLSSLSDESPLLSDKSFRLVEQFLLESGKDWSTLIAFVFEDQKYSQTWTSLGVRPVFFLSEHINLAVELGYDRVKPELDKIRTLNKVTLALQLSAADSFWSRPVFRLFITYAEWNRAALDAGLVHGFPNAQADVFEQKNNGLNYGFQLEHWW